MIAQDPSVLHAFRQNAHRAFALHLGLGIGAGVLVGLILLFAMGII